MDDGRFPLYVQYLLKTDAYPHSVSEISLVQTHISYVFLAGDRVYKFKKPLDFGFLDFTTLNKRKYYCEQELLLNRRLCPDIYLDLASIRRDHAGNFSLDGHGEAVEYGVKMKRMPEEHMMGNVIRAGCLNRDWIDAIVNVLVPFYRDSEQVSPHFGTAEAISMNILENLFQVKSFIGEALEEDQFARIAHYSHGFLKRKKLFHQRLMEGRIRNCHGDLYSANICLSDAVYIFDCIEFNERFRFIDVASDVSFLAMDLDFHGLEDLSDYFIRKFQQASGDQGLVDVLNFYQCYRAMVRGKIGLLTAHEPEVDQEIRVKALADAGKYFQLADHYAAQ